MEGARLAGRRQAMEGELDMGKCFLGLWIGMLLGLDYFVCSFAEYGPHWANALGGAVTWVFVGGVLTMIALAGYAVYSALQERSTQ